MGLNDLIGKRVHRLTILSEERTRDGVRYFKCRCDCGNIKVTRGVSLNNGGCKSCGCLQKEKAAKLGRSKRRHGFSGTRFYKIWKGMKNRCYNQNEPAYPRYGGRGICVVKRWDVFGNFRDDMYEDYLAKAREFGEENISIDRSNNDGNYCRANCRWTTLKVQNSNRGIRKLGPNDVRAIRKNYQYGNGRILAKKYGVSSAVISEIVNRKRNYA